MNMLALLAVALCAQAQVFEDQAREASRSVGRFTASKPHSLLLPGAGFSADKACDPERAFVDGLTVHRDDFAYFDWLHDSDRRNSIRVVLERRPGLKLELLSGEGRLLPYTVAVAPEAGAGADRLESYTMPWVVWNVREAGTGKPLAEREGERRWNVRLPADAVLVKVLQSCGAPEHGQYEPELELIARRMSDWAFFRVRLGR